MSAWNRIRWNNVARAAAAAAAVAVVVAWPRLSSPAPDVPDGAAIPVVAPAAATPEPETVPPRRATATEISGDKSSPEQAVGDRPRSRSRTGKARAARKRRAHPRTPGRAARIPPARRPAASPSPGAVAAPAPPSPTSAPHPPARTPGAAQTPVPPQAPAASPPEFGFER